MNAQAILQKIEDDAQKAAERLASDAENKASELKTASDKRIQALHDDLALQAQTEGEAQADRMSRMAELDMRKQLLQKKREVMGEAFESAKAELCRQAAADTRAFMLAQLLKAAQGDEQLQIGAENAAWFDGDFLGEINQKLGGKLTLSPDRREGVTGAVLLRGGTEVLVTYESLLDNARNHLETEIAKILFNE